MLIIATNADYYSKILIIFFRHINYFSVLFFIYYCRIFFFLWLKKNNVWFKNFLFYIMLLYSEVLELIILKLHMVANHKSHGILKIVVTLFKFLLCQGTRNTMNTYLLWNEHENVSNGNSFWKCHDTIATKLMTKICQVFINFVHIRFGVKY